MFEVGLVLLCICVKMAAKKPSRVHHGEREDDVLGEGKCGHN